MGRVFSAVMTFLFSRLPDAPNTQSELKIAKHELNASIERAYKAGVECCLHDEKKD